ncbi:MAG: sigma 54-interacting transcriptional regulator [Desulfobacterales bacterium]|nr:sigma 54-interacting transcriptional regulator [Desulfobacterales bacterium]
MKKRIFIALTLYSLIFLAGGVYIMFTIESSTGKLNTLILLHQVEIQRKMLSSNLKKVQLDLNFRQTPQGRGAATIIANVKELEKLSHSCFSCHHDQQVNRRLVHMDKGIGDYKNHIIGVLTLAESGGSQTIGGNEKAHQMVERIITEVDDMIHTATAKLSEKTEQSTKDIARAKMLLFLVVGSTPILAAVFGYFFLKGFTHPIRVLLEATQKIKSGSLDFRITGLKDEFGKVADSFNNMASRMETYTRQLEGKSLELERAHNEMSTFCQVLKQIGVQQTLDGVASFLMRELEPILQSAHTILYVFSSDRGTLFTLSASGSEVHTDPELIQTASIVLDHNESMSISPKMAFAPPLLPRDFPVDGIQCIIPLQIQSYIDGAFVVVYAAKALCEKTKLERVALILEQASGSIKRAVLQEEERRKQLAEGRADPATEYCGIVGKDLKMQSIYKLIEDIAPSDTTILIQGETGTGKELVASAIHQKSLRKNNPFVVINCSAYPATLLESELFGHEKGAFTGAVRQKSGRFEQADGGTVFLDEIGEIPLSSQIKLLRVLQTQKFERIGGEQTLSVDVRILSASNKDLLQEVKTGRFREDLYYRLNVIPIQIPPLRERRNDIPLQAKYFLKRFAAEQGKEITEFSSEAMKQLIDYSWPGNVRELENCIEHAAVLAKRKRIETIDLPSTLHQASSDSAFSSRGTITQNEAKLLKDALEESHWNKKTTAERLGISRNTLYRKIQKYKIYPPANI